VIDNLLIGELLVILITNNITNSHRQNGKQIKAPQKRPKQLSPKMSQTVPRLDF